MHILWQGAWMACCEHPRPPFAWLSNASSQCPGNKLYLHSARSVGVLLQGTLLLHHRKWNTSTMESLQPWWHNDSIEESRYICQGRTTLPYLSWRRYSCCTDFQSSIHRRHRSSFLSRKGCALLSALGHCSHTQSSPIVRCLGQKHTYRWRQLANS